MAARKRAPKKKAGKLLAAERPLIEGPEERDGAKYFSASDLSTYELSRERLENSVLRSEVLSHRIEKEIAESQKKVRGMRVDLTTALREIDLHRKTVVEVEAAITETYSVDLQKITYDTKTGRINMLNQPVDGEDHGNT